MTRIITIIGVLLVATTSAGIAQEVTRSGPNGSVTKTYDPATGLSIAREGVNGGSSSATVTCGRGFGLRCQRDYAITGPEGQTITGQRNSRFGRFRGGSVNTITGPQGNTATRYRPAFRYNRPIRRRW